MRKPVSPSITKRRSGLCRVFADELGIDIYAPRWKARGTSEAKRLRDDLHDDSAPDAVNTLWALWEYREAERRRQGTQESVSDAVDRFYDLIERLSGRRP